LRDQPDFSRSSRYFEKSAFRFPDVVKLPFTGWNARGKMERGDLIQRRVSAIAPVRGITQRRKGNKRAREMNPLRLGAFA
jgi:hypothetical protein